jgi:hypothetical protein
VAKFKFQAGAEFDVLTEKELSRALDRMSADWMAEVTRGFKYRRFLGVGTIAGAAVTIDESNPDNILGPGNGLIWAVNSLVVGGLAVADSVDVLINGGDPVATFTRVAGSGNYVRTSFGQTDLVLNGNDFLTLTGTGLTATGQIRLFGRCTELPRTLAYKLV